MISQTKSMVETDRHQYIDALKKGQNALLKEIDDAFLGLTELNEVFEKYKSRRRANKNENQVLISKCDKLNDMLKMK